VPLHQPGAVQESSDEDMGTDPNNAQPNDGRPAPKVTTIRSDGRCLVIIKTNFGMVNNNRFVRLADGEARARASYQEAGYPSINWEDMGRRVSKRRYRDAAINAIANGEDDWEEYEDPAENGNNMLVTERSGDTTKGCAGDTAGLDSQDGIFEVPGYYGERGRKLLYKLADRDFGQLLRARAKGLNLEKTMTHLGGWTNFMLTVLVAELGIELIREDMNLSRDDALNVMLGSQELGKLLYPE
jgi:hypothetical protein